MFPFLYIYYINVDPAGITSQCTTLCVLNHFSKTHSPINSIKLSGKYMYHLLLHQVIPYFPECIYQINTTLFSQLTLSCPHNEHIICSLWGENWIFTCNLEARHFLFAVVYWREAGLIFWEISRGFRKFTAGDFEGYDTTVWQCIELKLKNRTGANTKDSTAVCLCIHFCILHYHLFLSNFSCLVH